MKTQKLSPPTLAPRAAMEAIHYAGEVGCAGPKEGRRLFEIGREGMAEVVLEGVFLLLAHAFGHKASSL